MPTEKINPLFRKQVILPLAVLFAMLHLPGCTDGGRGGESNACWRDSAYALYQPMEILYFAGETDSVLMVAPRVMDFCSEHAEWTIYYTTWERKAEMWIWQSDYDRAAREAGQMRDDAERRNNSYGMAMAYYVMAQGYIVLDNYDEATRCYGEAISRYPGNESPGMLNLIYNYYCQALVHLGDYKRMGEVQEQWKKMIDTHPVADGDPQRDVYANWRMQYFCSAYQREIELHHFDEAAQALDSARFYEVIDGNIPMNVNTLMRYRSQIENARGRYAEALAYADSSAAMARTISDSDYIGALEERTKALKGLGRFEEALADHEQLKALYDSITQADNREQLNVLNKRFEVAELQLQHQHTRNRLYLALAAVVLLAIVLVSYAVHTRRIHQKNRKLYEQILQLQETEDNRLSAGADSQASVTEGSSQQDEKPSKTILLFASICRLMTEEHLYTNADLNRSDLAKRLGTNEHYIADRCHP